MVGPPLLDALLAVKRTQIEQFQRENPDVWAAVNRACIFGHNALSAVRSEPTDRNWTPVDDELYLIWQWMFAYQRESFFLAVANCLDESAAVLRLAAELTRDAARLSDSEALLAVRNRRLGYKVDQIKYRQQFRFREDNDDEAQVKRVYDWASRFSVHGHLQRLFALEEQGRVAEEGFESHGVSKEAPLRWLLMWLSAFFPMHQLCAARFLKKEMRSVVSAFSEKRQIFDQTFMPVFNRLIPLVEPRKKFH